MGTSEWALVVSAAGFVFIVLERTFGGGNALAAKFAKLKEETTKEVTDLRREMTDRVDVHAANTRVATDSIQANIAMLRESILEFRARLAEEYMDKDMFHATVNEIKRDFKDANADIKKTIGDGFDRVEDRFSTVERIIENNRKEAAENAKS